MPNNLSAKKVLEYPYLTVYESDRPRMILIETHKKFLKPILRVVRESKFNSLEWATILRNDLDSQKKHNR